MSLNFKKAKSKKDMKRIHDYTIDAFSDTPDFKWTMTEIENEVELGWELFGVYNEEEDIVASLFYKIDTNCLLTKNSGLRILHQGSGYNHEIKEYLESVAVKKGLKSIIHYCRIDNFRMYSLNESHGYEKTGHNFSDGQVVEWEKNLK